MKRPPSIPLARLLAMAFRSLIDDLHAELRRRGYRDLRPAYGFVLLAARSQPLAINDVAALIGATKQAASKLVDAMEAAGYVARADHPKDARSKLVVLTRRGERLLETVEDIYSELEGQWAAVVGKRRLEELRSDLVALVETRHDGTLPAVRPTW